MGFEKDRKYVLELTSRRFIKKKICIGIAQYEVYRERKYVRKLLSLKGEDGINIYPGKN